MDQMERIVQEVLENPKVNKLSDEEKQALKPTIERYVRRTILQIKAHCNRDNLPEALEEVVVMITEDMLKADKVIDEESEVSSVSRGDTSISYRDPKSAYQQSISFMKNYECQLVHFKKMKLPRDSHDD